MSSKKGNSVAERRLVIFESASMCLSNIDCNPLKSLQRLRSHGQSLEAFRMVLCLGFPTIQPVTKVGCPKPLVIYTKKVGKVPKCTGGMCQAGFEEFMLWNLKSL